MLAENIHGFFTRQAYLSDYLDTQRPSQTIKTDKIKEKKHLLAVSTHANAEMIPERAQRRTQARRRQIYSTWTFKHRIPTSTRHAYDIVLPQLAALAPSDLGIPVLVAQP